MWLLSRGCKLFLECYSYTLCKQCRDFFCTVNITLQSFDVSVHNLCLIYFLENKFKTGFKFLRNTAAREQINLFEVSDSCVFADFSCSCYRLVVC